MDLPFVQSHVPADTAALAGWQSGDAWLAGGTWLFSEPQPQLRRLLDLQAFAWEPLRVSEEGLEIAATCRLSDLAGFEPPPRWRAGHVIRRCCEALLGSFKVWNEATVGGNVCLSLAAAPMTSLAASLDGVCEVWHGDGRTELVAGVDFVTGICSNVLAPGSLLRSIRLPERTLRCDAAFRQVSRTPIGRSAALVIGTRYPGEDPLTITVTASVTRPLQLRFAAPPDQTELRDAIRAADPPYFEDAHGTPAWRAHLTELLSGQVLTELTGEMPR
jgi:CO/xanthine dehydrogenase FAD-binding subunit